MLNDAEQILQERQIDSAAAQIFAIQAGLERGKKRSIKLIFVKSLAAVLTAAIMITGLLFFNPAQFLPQQGSSTLESSDWGVLEPFKKLADADIDALTLESAIRNNYVQIVNKSTEKNGYKVTLNAVLADENKIILLYTGTTSNGQEIFSVNSAKLTDAVTGLSIVDDNGYRNGMGTHPKDSIYTWLGKTSNPLDKNKPTPKEVVASFQITSVDPGMLAKPKTGTILADMRYSDLLQIRFTMYTKFWEQKTETIVLNQPFMIDGHEVNLAKVELSPLSIVVDYTLSEQLKSNWGVRNKMFGNSPSELISRVGKQDKINHSIGGRGSEAGYTSYFSSNVLDHPKSIRLKLDEGPDRDKEEYIDILEK